eukprot:UN18914
MNLIYNPLIYSVRFASSRNFFFIFFWNYFLGCGVRYNTCITMASLIRRI